MNDPAFLGSAVTLEQLPRTGRPQVALVGRSNAGKSTLVNALANRKGLARVSSAPGRTATINAYHFAPGYDLLDLPGYGFATYAANRARFADLITTYLEAADRLALVFIVLDARRGLTDVDVEMADWLVGIGRPVAFIANKIDKLKRPEVRELTNRLAEAYPDVPCFVHAAPDSSGRGEIRAHIERAVRKMA